MKKNISSAIKSFALVSLILLCFFMCSKQRQNVFEKGFSLEKDGKYEEAIDKYRGALDNEPKNAKIHLRLAISLSSIGKLDEAGQHYIKAVNIDPNNLEAHLNFSGFHFKTRNYDMALLELGEVIKINPESNEAEIARGLIGRVEKAKIRNELIRKLENEIQAGSSDKETSLKLGRAYIEEGEELLAQNRREEAITEYIKAIKLMPKNGEFRYLFAQMYDRIGEKDKALKENELANELEPNNLRYMISLAGLYIHMGKIEEGKKLLQQVIDLDSKSEEAGFAKRRLEELEMKEKDEKEKKVNL